MTTKAHVDDFIYGMVDRLIDKVAPGGVATDPSVALTNEAFDYYVATHGLPSTANQARHMFEWAACFPATIEFVTRKAPSR